MSISDDCVPTGMVWTGRLGCVAGVPYWEVSEDDIAARGGEYWALYGLAEISRDVTRLVRRFVRAAALA